MHDKIDNYLKLSNRKPPGPIVSMVPYVDSTRLIEEFERTKSVRNKMQHEGLTFEHYQYGLMQRILETMTWFFSWISRSHKYDITSSRFYSLKASLHKPMLLPFEYKNSGINLFDSRLQNKTSVLLTSMYGNLNRCLIARNGGKADLPLLMKKVARAFSMIYKHHSDDCESNGKTISGLLGNGKKQTLVFCSDNDLWPDSSELDNIASSAFIYACKKKSMDFALLYVVNSQRHLRVSDRSQTGLLDAIKIPLSRLHRMNICIITAPQLASLILLSENGTIQQHEVREMLSTPGVIYDSIPFGYEVIGVVRRTYKDGMIVSINLSNDKVLYAYEKICIKGNYSFTMQTVHTMQIDKKSVMTAWGGTNVGVELDNEVPWISPGNLVLKKTKLKGKAMK